MEASMSSQALTSTIRPAIPRIAPDGIVSNFAGAGQTCDNLSLGGVCPDSVASTVSPLGLIIDFAAGATTTANGAVIHDYGLERDALDRIIRRTETVGGVTTDTRFAYDSAGRRLVGRVYVRRQR